MREPFKDLVLTLRVRRDDEAIKDERFRAGLDEYPSACGIGRTADEALQNFSELLSRDADDPLTVKNLKRAAHRHAEKEAKRAPKSVARKKRSSDD